MKFIDRPEYPTFKNRKPGQFLVRMSFHPVPFLKGDDGVTWRQRRASARRYAKAMRR